MNQLNPRQINTTALAYIGDAVYEIYVRERVLGASGGNCAAVFGAVSGVSSGTTAGPTTDAVSGVVTGAASGATSASSGMTSGGGTATFVAALGASSGAVSNRQKAFGAPSATFVAVPGGASGKQKAYGAHVDALHRRAIRYVRADGQAKAIKAMLAEGFLTAEEEALVRRARNHKSASKPKNADAMDYKYATAFEALIGFWHLMARRGDSAGAESPGQGLPTGAEQLASGEAQPLPAAGGAGGRAEEAAKQRPENIIFRAFAIIEGADAISGHGR